jgi:hypothetical protein
LKGDLRPETPIHARLPALDVEIEYEIVDVRYV